ncbi:MAG: pyridoxal-5-phosphate-dependent protein subunit beta, partial [Clostridia bacterium]|nr:pyridoxal-5-phosphate-dependent protein subunit beta [Clostridia bacterium]
FDKTWELRRTRKDCVIFNQFEEMGNCVWHYQVTGKAIQDAFESIKREGDRFAGACFTSGSAGTMSSGDYLKEQYPTMKLAVGEALQCPTLLNNGFGGHRIEGIGDKHVPWIHNVKNTDMVIAIDDEDSQKLLRLFNDPVGRKYLVDEVGVPADFVEKLSLLGISGIANLLCCIKMAKYYELTEHDVIATVGTDSSDMYVSRIQELEEADGAYTPCMAAADYAEHLKGIRTDTMEELTYQARKRVHNLKYYTWVEQQGKTYEEINQQWYDEHYWTDMHAQADEIDELINEFNESTGVLKNL